MKKWLLPTLVFVLSTSLALYNIGGFPKIIGDEGIYVSQAYWLTKLGQLGPYTYWYDHFPLGWLQIGLWQLIIGPATFFGQAVLSARVLMAILLGGTTTTLYLLTKNLTKSQAYASLAAFIFSTSTLTLTFGRMVLLDNIAIFWFLLSIYVLFSHPTRLKNLAFSAIFLCVGILSKESLLFFVPPYLYLVYALNRTNPNRQYGVLVSSVTTFFFLSFFPLLALLKGEFFPRPGQVSFLDTMLFQSQRGSGLPFWDPNSHFRNMLAVWLDIDPVLILVGSVASLALPLLQVKKPFKLISLFSLFFLIFLLRGGQLYEFYIIPLIPLLVLNLILFLQHLSDTTKNKLITPLFTLSLLVYITTRSLYPFTTSATASQLEAINTLIKLSPEGIILAPNYAHLDVYLSGNHNIHWYDKSEADPTVTPLLPKVTEILVDEQFARDLSGEQLPKISALIPPKMLPTQFGDLQAPGQKFIPYTTELLNLYSLTSSKNNTSTTLIAISNITNETLVPFSTNPPAGIMITRNNFSNSIDLQEKLNLIRSLLPSTKIYVSQDGEGNNSIPWISVDSRSFFKSAAEANAASLKKTTALQSLGFDGAVVASSNNADGYLETIFRASDSNFTPIIRFDGTHIPSGNFNLLIDNQLDLDRIKNAGFNGNLYLITSSR